MFKLRIRRLCLFFLAALFLFTAARPAAAQSLPPAQKSDAFLGTDHSYQTPPCPLSGKYAYGWDGSSGVYCQRSIVIFVHGVYTSSSVYSQWIDGLFNSGEYPELSSTFYVSFNWAEDNFLQASDQVGGRANSVTGMSDLAFYAVWKLGQTVARLQRLFPELPITIISHSQGTLVTLAALQEGMAVDNWILMGSPLDQGIVAGCEDGENVNLPLAATHVRGWVWNFWSQADQVVAALGGIGAYGLQTRCGSEGWYGSNVYNTEITNIDHFEFLGNDNSWWDFEQLRSNMTPDVFNTLLSALTANNGPLVGYLQPDIDQFNNWEFRFANDPPMMCTAQGYCVPYEFQDNNYDSLYYDFLLPQGLETGWYMDDKDRGHYTFACYKGGAAVRLRGAQWSDFDEGEDWVYVGQGYQYDSSYTVDSWMYDATLWVQVSNADPGISECSLFFEAWDD